MAESAIAAVDRLKVQIGIPQRLRELGVERQQLRGLAEKAFTVKRILRVNPRPVTVDDLLGILEAAW
jgi:alcohol dehydrogenase class IV